MNGQEQNCGERMNKNIRRDRENRQKHDIEKEQRGRTDRNKIMRIKCLKNIWKIGREMNKGRE
jgi:hypothetical protein